MSDTAELNAVARESALLQYAAAHDAHSTEEQLAVERGDYVEAEGRHQYAAWVVRAYRSELDDPKPDGIGRA